MRTIAITRYMRRIREVESYRLIDVLIIAGLTALVAIHLARVASHVA